MTKSKHMVIYKEGESNIQTGVTNGLCDYTGGKTVEQYLDKLGAGYSCISLSDALEKINAVDDKTLIGAWIEIDADRYMKMLEVLPPEKWHSKGPFEIFRLSEYTTSNITAHFVHVRLIGSEDRYFEANRRTSVSYDTITLEILALLTDDAGSNVKGEGL